MDREEALKLLESKLVEYRRLSYAEAAAKTGSEDVFELTGPSGTTYQIEVQLVWDGKPNGDVRVLGAVDDGGWRAFAPLTADVLIRREDGTVTDSNRDVAAGRRLEQFTLGWNAVEAVIGIGAGIYAGSTALLGFGLDSVIESLSGAVLLWRLWDEKKGDARERQALKLVGVSFLVLAVYVAYEATATLAKQEPPEASYVGIGLAVASVVVMPLLARAKRRVAARLGSRALIADSRQTDICSYLSAILLLGLGANALFGWWWADPVAGLLMVSIIGKEGVEALRGDSCACHGDQQAQDADRTGTSAN